MLTKNNWFELSWDGLPQRTKAENISAKINRRAKQLLPFDKACDQVATEIADQYKNIFITLSGGCDSENVANTFYRNKIPFTPLIITYNKTLGNDQRYEQWYARYWCKQHNITPMIIDYNEFVESDRDRELFLQLKPRLYVGAVTQFFISELARQHNANLVTGFQLEYYPDAEQMTYLESQLGSYQGFVLEESDNYIEAIYPNTHPWAFYYWSPEIMASFVNEWDTNSTMQENKAHIYKVSPRPKMSYPGDIYPDNVMRLREQYKKKWGTRDCALMGSKEHLLSLLLE